MATPAKGVPGTSTAGSSESKSHDPLDSRQSSRASEEIAVSLPTYVNGDGDPTPNPDCHVDKEAEVDTCTYLLPDLGRCVD